MFNRLSSTQSANDSLFGFVHGVYIGVVTDNKDHENLGRVKVKIPVFDNDNSQDWARVASFMAGSQRGSLFLPEIGDEVLVAFLMGDVSKPIVIGSLWSKKAPPPDPDKDNNIRKIKSRSGHEIVLDDTNGDEKMILKSKDGHTLEISDKNDKVTLKEKSGKSMLILTGGSQQSIEVKSGTTTIKMNDKGDVTIESAKAMKLKSPQITVEASATMDLKAGASLNLKSDGMINIKGSMVKIN